MFGEDDFDIVIGNPPYVFTRDVDFGVGFKDYVNDEYFKDIALPSKSKSRQAGKINLFAIFLLKGKKLIKKNGNLIYIIPNNILRGTVYDVIRYELLKNNDINSIVDLGEGVFSKVTASTILFQLSNKTSQDFETEILTDVESLQENKYKTKYINQNVFLENTSYTFNIMLNKKQMELSGKIDKNKKSLGECCIDIIAGIAASKDLIFVEALNSRFSLFKLNTKEDFLRTGVLILKSLSFINFIYSRYSIYTSNSFKFSFLNILNPFFYIFCFRYLNFYSRFRIYNCIDSHIKTRFELFPCWRKNTSIYSSFISFSIIYKTSYLYLCKTKIIRV